MHIKTLLSCTILSILFFSCNNSKPPTLKSKIKFSIPLLESQQDSIISTNEILKDFQFFELKENDTTKILAGIDKLIIEDDNFYILDKRFSRVARYDNTGIYRNDFGKVGVSYADHKRVSDIDISKGKLHMWDADNKAIKKYTLDGKLTSTLPLDIYADKFTCLSNGTGYLFYINYNNSDEADANNILKVSPLGKIEKRLLPFSKADASETIDFSGFVTKSNGKVFYSDAYNSLVYTYPNEEDTLNMAISIPLQDPFTIKNIKKINLITQRLTDLKTATGFLGKHFMMNSHYCVFTYVLHNKLKTCIYNLQNQKLKIIDRGINDPFIYTLGNPLFLDSEDNLYFGVAPQIINNLKRDIAKSNPNESELKSWTPALEKTGTHLATSFSILKTKITL